MQLCVCLINNSNSRAQNKRFPVKGFPITSKPIHSTLQLGSHYLKKLQAINFILCGQYNHYERADFQAFNFFMLFSKAFHVAFFINQLYYITIGI